VRRRGRSTPIAATEGTPLYVYSAATIAGAIAPSTRRFAGIPHAIHYALKANSTLAITRLLRGLGSSADANSGGEIDVALRAGFIPAQSSSPASARPWPSWPRPSISASAPSTSSPAGEIERVDALSRERRRGRRSRSAINPDVDAKTHPHISTGLKINKFGIADRRRRGAVRPRARPGRRRGRRPARAHRLADHRPRAADARPRGAWSLARELAATGTRIEHLDLGGGLGVSYDGSRVPTAQEYADAVLPIVRESGLAIVLEPGARSSRPPARS
jgi:diaminopimelate decarboxylase